MDFEKNAFTKIRVEKRTYREKDYIDIRQYYRDTDDSFKPSAKGVTLAPELLPELIDALGKLRGDI